MPLHGDLLSRSYCCLNFWSEMHSALLVEIEMLTPRQENCDEKWACPHSCWCRNWRAVYCASGERERARQEVDRWNNGWKITRITSLVYVYIRAKGEELKVSLSLLGAWLFSAYASKLQTILLYLWRRTSLLSIFSSPHFSLNDFSVDHPSPTLP